MKRIRMVGLCLVAVVALTAVAAGSAAAAEPALYECGKAGKETVKYISGGKEKSKSVATGSYTEKKCATLAPAGTYRAGGAPEGKYELREGIGKGKAFKGKGKGANLEIKGVGGVACTSSSDTGKFTGPKSAGGVSVTFKGCELLHHQCSNTATLGEIKTNLLKGEIGYIEGGKAKHEVGVALSAETGLYEAEFHCAELELRVAGAVIGLVTSPKNVFTKEATLLFRQSAGEQAIKKLEGGLEQFLLTEGRSGGGAYGSPSESGESDEVTNKGEELELKA
jgi:hypothetical protein